MSALRSNSIYRSFAKRAIDIVVSLSLLCLLIWLIAALYVLVRLRLGSPVLFRQQRPGLDGRPFVLVKFRTMTDARDESGALLPDVVRLTRFGRFLRATSLDELPTLWNVIRGDMSLVGPRPLLVQYLERYTPQQARRHEVRPGITGWAQVTGRNAMSWPDKLAKDVWYVDHVSFWLDLKILVKTVIVVFRRDGIAHGQHATMPEFLGQNENCGG